MDEFRNDNSFSEEEKPETNDSAEAYENDIPSNADDSFHGYAAGDDEASYESTEYTSSENRDVYSQSYEEKSTGYANGYDYANRTYAQNDNNSAQGGYDNNPYRRQATPDGAYHYRYVGNENYYQPPQAPKKKGTGKKAVAIILALLVIVASVGIGTAIGRKSANKIFSPESTETSKTTADSAVLDVQGSTDTGDADAVSPGISVAKKARSSIVGVVVYDSTGALYGEGSGVVMGVGSSGQVTYIITCAHVISDSGVKSCGVLLEDGTVYDATIVGFDERTDIGVISVKGTDLPAASFGDSNALQVGETVYAIGNPGGSEYYGSVSDGIVSAVDRSITSTYTMEVIQHTAAISPGNSGGALVNSSGQVVGINSSKISATDYEGIGFAVPMATAKPIVESIIEYGYVPNRPKLGISYASVTRYQLYSMVVQIKGLPSGSLIIADISDDSSLADTKVQTGDMITAVNGKKLTSSDILLDIIDNSKVGDTLTLTICRINARTYEISTFEVTAKLVEDKGSSVKEQETTTQSYYDYYYNNGGNFEDFFNHFFGN